MSIKSITGHESAQVKVIYVDERNFSLVSYRTTVCDVIDNVLFVNGLYSATTRKHISWFMREYTNYSYYDAKCAYENGAGLDLSTGLYIYSEDFNG